MPLRGPASWSRETRLLCLTIGVSVTVLLVLARFRFPEESRAAPAPPPLERLTARATYDELAADVARLERRVSSSLVVLRVQPTRFAEPRTLQQLIDRRGSGPTASLFVPALRIRDQMAIALLDRGVTVQAVLGHDDAVPLVLAADPLRRLAIVRVPPPPANAAWQLPSIASLPVPRYVAAIEGSHGGSTMHPLFLGRADRFEEPRWTTPLIALGTTPVAAQGAFVVSLEGELVGMVTEEAGVLALVPGAALDAAANALLADGSPHVTDFGVSLRALDGADVRTLGITAGLFVDSVQPKSLADTRLRPGDLLLAIDGRPPVDAEATLLLLSKVRPGTTVRFHVRRKEERLDIDIPVPGGPTIGTVR
jgi:hypothetical protein